MENKCAWLAWDGKSRAGGKYMSQWLRWEQNWAGDWTLWWFLYHTYERVIVTGLLLLPSTKTHTPNLLTKKKEKTSCIVVIIQYFFNHLLYLLHDYLIEKYHSNQSFCLKWKKSLRLTKAKFIYLIKTVNTVKTVFVVLFSFTLFRKKKEESTKKMRK